MRSGRRVTPTAYGRRHADHGLGADLLESPWRICQTAGVPQDHGAFEERQAAWRQRQRRLKIIQNSGLVVLAIGVLIMAYEALGVAVR